MVYHPGTPLTARAGRSPTPSPAGKTRAPSKESPLRKLCMAIGNGATKDDIEVPIDSPDGAERRYSFYRDHWSSKDEQAPFVPTNAVPLGNNKIMLLPTEVPEKLTFTKGEPVDPGVLVFDASETRFFDRYTHLGKLAPGFERDTFRDPERIDAALETARQDTLDLLNTMWWRTHAEAMEERQPLFSSTILVEGKTPSGPYKSVDLTVAVFAKTTETRVAAVPIANCVELTVKISWWDRVHLDCVNVYAITSCFRPAGAGYSYFKVDAEETQTVPTSAMLTVQDGDKTRVIAMSISEYGREFDELLPEASGKSLYTADDHKFLTSDSLWRLLFKQGEASVVLREPVQYKFRAECTVDVGFFQKKLTERITTEKMDRDLPDVWGYFTSTKPLKWLWKIAAATPDCHVIAQTLRPRDEYTGVRTLDAYDA